MKSVTILFPHQLFEEHEVLKLKQPIYLVEESLFFTQYKFHKQKIVFHRATMKCYESYLKTKGFDVNYIDSYSPQADIRKLIKQMKTEGIEEIQYIDVVDNWLQKRIVESCKKTKIKLIKSDTTSFLNTQQELEDYFEKKKKYFQTDFYIAQRKKRNVLVDANQKPIGDKWTFDSDNRKRLPKDEVVPVLPVSKENKFVKEAKQYVNTYFADNYGDVNNFIYPIDFTSSSVWLNDFFKYRFKNFGIYEDAMVAGENYLFHSILSPLLNTGLLTPREIIDKAIDYAQKNNVPLNSLEGFIRQIMGWREFIRAVYEREGSRQRTTNYWKFTRKIPKSFWQGTTGIAPVDNVIKKALQTSYSHHIERLMVMGNFMLLCEFDPDEVYLWFMEMYIDAYDWVMVPNVYGMTQFADGGLMTTKPYISGSNYLLKMSDYKKDEKWTAIWDALFWRFMHVHRKFFLSNPRLGMLVRTFDKMSDEKKKLHLQTADKFLKQLDKEAI